MRSDPTIGSPTYITINKPEKLESMPLNDHRWKSYSVGIKNDIPSNNMARSNNILGRVSLPITKKKKMEYIVHYIFWRAQSN
jgi:hypothetical protein